MTGFKLWYYVKPSYFFLLDKGPFWSKPFCVLSTVIKGDRTALEFAEKSLQFGKYSKLWCKVCDKTDGILSGF